MEDNGKFYFMGSLQPSSLTMLDFNPSLPGNDTHSNKEENSLMWKAFSRKLYFKEKSKRTMTDFYKQEIQLVKKAAFYIIRELKKESLCVWPSARVYHK